MSKDLGLLHGSRDGSALHAHGNIARKQAEIMGKIGLRDSLCLWTFALTVSPTRYPSQTLKFNVESYISNILLCKKNY